MKEDELDDLLRGALQKDRPQVTAPKEETSSRWRVNKEMMVRWSIIGAFTLTAILIVYFTGGIDRLADRLLEVIAEVETWIKKF